MYNKDVRGFIQLKKKMHNKSEPRSNYSMFN